MNELKRIPLATILIVLGTLMASLPAVAVETVQYIHTDALGSPVAVTDAGGSVIERTVYEPYGEVAVGSAKDAPGYTGHVYDSATGLSYMQQRYMDPQLGVFLSVHPVQAFDQPVAQFSRYRYGNGNPYKFADPDGRSAVALEFLAIPIVVGITAYYMSTPQQKEAAARLIDEGVDKLVQMAESGGGDGDGTSGDQGSRGSSGGERAGKPFTKAGKGQVKAENAEKHGGQTTCEDCLKPTVPAVKSQSGVTPPKDETAVDHVIPRSKGGDGSPNNGQVLCRECNGRKSDKL